MGLGLMVTGVVTVVASADDTDPKLRVLGGNLPVNAGAIDPRDSSAHNSPTVVRNPIDGANVVVANRIDSPRFSCGLHVSLDGGLRWTQTPLPVPPGAEPKCYAPDAAFGADGTLYVSFVTLEGTGNVPHAVWLVSSTDQGRNLSDPIQILGPLAFQVRLVADHDRPARLYKTWVQAAATALYAFPEPGYPIMAARSEDGGLSWSEPVRVSESGRERVVAPSPAVGPGGSLYVLYLDLRDDALDYHGAHAGRGGDPYPETWQLVLARSEDGGANWAQSVVEEAVVPTERFLVFLPPFPSIAVDRRSRVFAAFHSGRLGDADVWVWASENGGASFGSGRRVNDTAEADGTSQYLPKVALAPDGRLDVLYYDRRADPNDVMNEVSLQSSFDGGRSFTHRANLTDRSFDSRIGFGSDRGLPDLGSRLGLVSGRSGTLAVWTDTRSGTEESPKQDLARVLVEISRSEQLLPAPVRQGLRLGGIAIGLAGLAVLASALAAPRARGQRPVAGGKVAPGASVDQVEDR